MGFWDTLKKHAGAQFLDVIEWLDDSNDTLVYRYPVFNNAIQDGGKLVVRPGQAGVFVSEGQLSDTFGPGTYELSTRTKAIASFFESIKYQLNYPYKGDIYFVSTNRFSDQKWGTPAPFLFQDPQYGGIEIRAFGIFEYRISDPAKFISEVVGTDGLFTTSEINGQFKRMLVDAFRAACKRLARENNLNVNQIDGEFFEIKDDFLGAITPKFEERYGVTITDFTVEGLNLPDDLRAILNKRREMDMLGDMNRYMQFQTANAIPEAAKNPGMGGAMMGAGMGFGMGNQVGNAMAGAMGGMHQAPQAAPPGPPPPPQAATFHYNGAGGQGQFSAQDIAQKVAANRAGNHSVWRQGFSGWMSWNQVPEIANLVPPDMPPPPARRAPSTTAAPRARPSSPPLRWWPASRPPPTPSTSSGSRASTAGRPPRRSPRSPRRSSPAARPLCPAAAVAPPPAPM
ncbi:MAG: SPFH domain-containing protein [Alphaproteobacteria bacterium]|nr:SPFH domain-containing protein [Alphaproteobacteria bacterium]